MAFIQLPLIPFASEAATNKDKPRAKLQLPNINKLDINSNTNSIQTDAINTIQTVMLQWSTKAERTERKATTQIQVKAYDTNSRCGCHTGRIEPPFVWYKENMQEGRAQEHNTWLDRS